MHVELRVNMAHVGFHRVVRQHELFLNDGARASARKQLEYLGFARGEAMLLGDGGAGGFERGVVRFLLKAFRRFGFFGELRCGFFAARVLHEAFCMGGSNALDGFGEAVIAHADIVVCDERERNGHGNPRGDGRVARRYFIDELRDGRANANAEPLRGQKRRGNGNRAQLVARANSGDETVHEHVEQVGSRAQERAMGLHVEWIGAAEKPQRRREEAAEKQQRCREEAGEYEQHRPSVKRVGGNRASHHDNDKRNGDGNERNKRSCNRGSAARSAKWKPHAMLNSRIETNARLENDTYEDGLVILSTLGAVES